VTIIAAGATDIGQKRKTNQDSICLYPQKKLFMVADGMGGHNGGDIASQMSVKLMPEFVESHPEMKVEDVIRESVLHINRSIYTHGQEHQELKGMGTTITGVMFDGANINIANVGDSRTYMVNHGKLYQMTRDHSLVQEKLNLGIYDREGAKADPQKNVLIRTVGFEPEIEVDVYQYKVSKNDIFIMCSDGLHGKVSDEDIIHIVNQNIPSAENAMQEDLEKTVKQLIDQANANGGQDNISVIITLAR
jgi:serine/threonine protein phosphatase PrpC